MAHTKIYLNMFVLLCFIFIYIIRLLIPTYSINIHFIYLFNEMKNIRKDIIQYRIHFSPSFSKLLYHNLDRFSTKIVFASRRLAVPEKIYRSRNSLDFFRPLRKALPRFLIPRMRSECFPNEPRSSVS